jgi:hypothetical protein
LALLLGLSSATAATLLVTEYGTGNLKAFNAASGAPIAVPASHTPIGGSGSGADGMALDAQGRLCVNRANGTVWRRSADGQTFALFATMPGTSSDFYLLDLAANATHLYGARFGSITIYRTALADGAVSTLAGPAAANRFDGVRIGPDGRLYAVDSENGRIYAYDLNAATWSAFLTNAIAGDASQLEFGADGRVFVSRTVGGQARIYSYTLNTPGNYAAGLNPASQTLVGAYGSSGAATGIRIGPDGRLYANAFNAGEIWRSNVGITAMESAAFISGLNEPGSIFFPDANDPPPTHTPRGTPYEWLSIYFPGQGLFFEALDEADGDGDGFATWQEYIADTDPDDSSSFFPHLKTQAAGRMLSSEIDPTSAARLYHLRMATNLVEANWIVLTNAPGTGDSLILQHETEIPGFYFFGTAVSLP